MSLCKTVGMALMSAAVMTVIAPSAHADDGTWSAFKAGDRDADALGVERHGHGDDHHSQRRHPRPFTIKIIGFNDFHGNLQSPGNFGVNTSIPLAQRPAVGGAEFLAAYVDRLKAQNPLNVVVGAGDFIGASPLASALFFDEPTVMGRLSLGLVDGWISQRAQLPAVRACISERGGVSRSLNV